MFALLLELVSVDPINSCYRFPILLLSSTILSHMGFNVNDFVVRSESRSLSSAFLHFTAHTKNYQLIGTSPQLQ